MFDGSVGEWLIVGWVGESCKCDGWKAQDGYGGVGAVDEETVRVGVWIWNY